MCYPYVDDLLARTLQVQQTLRSLRLYLVDQLKTPDRLKHTISNGVPEAEKAVARKELLRWEENWTRRLDFETEFVVRLLNTSKKIVNEVEEMDAFTQQQRELATDHAAESSADVRETISAVTASLDSIRPTLRDILFSGKLLREEAETARLRIPGELSAWFEARIAAAGTEKLLSFVRPIVEQSENSAEQELSRILGSEFQSLLK